MTILNIILLASSILLLILTLDLIRRKHLREKYSILWILVFIGLIILSLSGRMVDGLASLLNVGYPPSILFLAGIFVLIILSLMISVIVSHQTDRIITLTQKIALLEEKITNKSRKPSA